MNEKPKEVRYCEHVQNQEARPYMRMNGAGDSFDLIVCWKCQNDMAPFTNRLNDIQETLARLLKQT